VISDMGFGEFRRQLEHKVWFQVGGLSSLLSINQDLLELWRDQGLVAIVRAFFKCGGCGLEIERDHNADKGPSRTALFDVLKEAAGEPVIAGW
jgi:hypothetical protein